MKAHYLPVAYLKGFGDDSCPKPEKCRAWVVRRRSLSNEMLRNIGVRKSFYVFSRSEDFKLFEEQERYFGTLLPKLEAGDVSVLSDVARQLWLLKLRNRTILDSTHHRRTVMEAGKSFPLGGRDSKVIEAAPGAGAFITSDDPLLLIGDEDPDRQCFLPRSHLVS